MRFNHMKRWQWWISFVVLLPFIIIVLTCRVVYLALALIAKTAEIIDPYNWTSNKTVAKIVDWGLGVK